MKLSVHLAGSVKVIRNDHERYCFIIILSFIKESIINFTQKELLSRTIIGEIAT